jgi:hypothetical protein
MSFVTKKMLVVCMIKPPTVTPMPPRSTDAKAGIIAVAVLLLMGALVFVIFMLHRRQQRELLAKHRRSGSGPTGPYLEELPTFGNSHFGAAHRFDKPASPASIADARRQIAAEEQDVARVAGLFGGLLGGH